MNLIKVGFVVFALTITIVVPSDVNADQQTKFGNWIFRISKDAMTDEIIKAAIVPNLDDDMNTRLFIVECAGGKELNVFLQTERFINLQNRASSVSYRFGDKKAVQQTWSVTPNETTALINTASKIDISNLIKELLSETVKFQLRYGDSNGTDYDVAFSLSGAKKALKGVVEACSNQL